MIYIYLCHVNIPPNYLCSLKIVTKHGNPNMNLGEGQFGIVLDVRPGKELEAEELRDEWRKETTEMKN